MSARLDEHRGESEADTDHLHHRLVRLGHGPRRAVMILWAWTALLSGVALLPLYTNRGNAMVPFALAAFVLVLYIAFHPGVRSARGRAGRARHPAGALNRADDGGAIDGATCPDQRSPRRLGLPFPTPRRASR